MRTNDTSLHCLSRVLMLPLFYFLLFEMQQRLISCLQQQSSICLQVDVSHPPAWQHCKGTSHELSAVCLMDFAATAHLAHNKPVAALIGGCCMLLSMFTVIL